MIEKSLKHFL